MGRCQRSLILVAFQFANELSQPGVEDRVGQEATCSVTLKASCAARIDISPVEIQDDQ
jgi:hypothetical protein